VVSILLIHEKNLIVEVSSLAIWVLLIASGAMWAGASFRFGQVLALACRDAALRFRSIKALDCDNTRSTRDALGERRMSIIANVAEGAAFIGTAGSVFAGVVANKSISDVLILLSAILLLLFCWGAIVESGTSHTFYLLSLNSKGYRRSRSAELSCTEPRGLQRIDFLPLNTLATQLLFTVCTALLLAWCLNLQRMDSANLIIIICLALTLICCIVGNCYENSQAS
jgi:hypothetical protein